jgi:hypothetical protein
MRLPLTNSNDSSEGWPKLNSETLILAFYSCWSENLPYEVKHALS